MALLQVKNRAVSALASGISDSDLSLTVTTGEGAKFPQPGNGFHITIEDEILKCTARSTDTLTVTRAQEGTSAAAHSSGAMVSLNITAQVITELQDGKIRTATKVVAASDSPTNSKLGADYVCDGTADNVEIQAAIDALPTAKVTTQLEGAVADDGGTQTDEIVLSREPTANDMTLLPATPAVNDAYYFGGHVRFNKLIVNIGTQGAGTWTITWEYWNGAWVALAGVTDGTAGFTAAAGNHDVTFTMPTDWVRTTVKKYNCFWIRARVSAYTSVTTQPKGTQAWIEIDGGGGTVALLEGTYIIESTISLPSNVTLQGQGVATVIKIKDSLGADLKMITNKDTDAGDYNIIIRDLFLDGNHRGQAVAALHFGIYLQRVDYSLITGVWANDQRYHQIELDNCHKNVISGCNCRRSRSGFGIYLYSGSDYNSVVNNVCCENVDGIKLDSSCHNTVDGNICSRGGFGIPVENGSDYNVISNNVCSYNGNDGIYLAYGSGGNHNVITGNQLIGNSQGTTNTDMGIEVSAGTYNLICNNLFRKGSETNQPAYGIHIAADANYNIIHGNDFYDAGATGDIDDEGTGTLKRDNRNLTGTGWLTDAP